MLTMSLKKKHENVFISGLRIKVAEAQSNFEKSVENTVFCIFVIRYK